MNGKHKLITVFTATVLVFIFCAFIPTSCSKDVENNTSQPPITETPAKQKEQVRGLFLNTANLPTQEWSRIERYILSDPTVSGTNIVVPWSKIDRGPDANPQYDWSYIEEIAQPWIKAGKKVNLLAWGAAQKSEQEIDGVSMTPDYVLKNVETVSCQCKVNQGCVADPPVTPVFWDEDYSSNYQKFVKALIAEYEDKPWIGYFRFGIGVGAESYPANGVSYAKNPCTAKWQKPSIGLSKEVWQEHSLKFVDFLGTISTPKPILVTINKYGQSNDLAIAVARQAAAKGIGIGTQGLTENAIALHNADRDCYADWCDLFNEYQGKVPLEVQTAAQSNPADKGRVGPLPPLLDFAIAQGADILELYQAEWFVANDPNHHLHRKYGKSYRQALDRAAAALK